MIRSREPVRCARLIGEQGTGDRRGLRQGRRAISGPLTAVTSGLSRSLADRLIPRSGHVTGPDCTDSQADSAGSIPVTRSTVKMQVRGLTCERNVGLPNCRELSRVCVTRLKSHHQPYQLTVPTCLSW